MKKRIRILVGISSGIAGYKILNLLKILKRDDIQLQVIMTRHAIEMFGREKFEKISGHKVLSEIISEKLNYKKILDKKEVLHIKLADSADILVIAPATANIISKLVFALADDMLTTIVLATRAPILICPSMNPNMWNNPAIIGNINTLINRGFYVLDPESGDLACGYKGVGRLPETDAIKKEIFVILSNKNRLKGKKILVTGGATREFIDEVRVITNKGSGKMGREIANVCQSMGAHVLFVRSDSSFIDTRDCLREEVFETGSQLKQILRKYVAHYDIIFHTASVADFTVQRKFLGKVDSEKSLNLKLVPTEKIINNIKLWNPKIKLIGFKAVYREKESNLSNIAFQKINETRADFMVVNDVGKKGIGFGADDNEVYIFSGKKFIKKISRTSKKEIAKSIINHTLF